MLGGIPNELFCLFGSKSVLFVCSHLPKSHILKAKAVLQRSGRGLVIARLPSYSVKPFGTRRQVRVDGKIEDVSFKTVAFPTGDGRHFVFVNQKMRLIAGVKSGD